MLKRNVKTPWHKTPIVSTCKGTCQQKTIPQ